MKSGNRDCQTVHFVQVSLKQILFKCASVLTILCFWHDAQHKMPPSTTNYPPEAFELYEHFPKYPTTGLMADQPAFISILSGSSSLRAFYYKLHEEITFLNLEKHSLAIFAMFAMFARQLSIRSI